MSARKHRVVSGQHPYGGWTVMACACGSDVVERVDATVVCADSRRLLWTVDDGHEVPVVTVPDPALVGGAVR